jgi:filamentous hemagglutinin family protein
VPGSPAAAAAAARAAQNAESAARQANEALVRASQALQRFRAQQDVARAAANAAPSSVPNGLTPGGLVIIPGASGDPELWSGASLPSQSSNGGRTSVQIYQDRPKAVLTWQSFNVGKETDVHFDQTAGGDSAQDWIALNRVNDPSARPSQILGSIRAEGQVYLINPNGIIFGGSSQVNVNSIIASGLDFYGATLHDKNEHFYNGILYNPNQRFTPALAFGEKLEATYDELHPNNPNANHDPNETFAPGDGVTIQAGAQVTATGGMAMFLGHNVNNEGAITATDGQVVLAAGRGIYLNNNAPRGFYPATKPFALDDTNRGLTIGVNRGGAVVNNGVIESDRGSVKITGKSIAQNGLVTVTTSASANGLITMTAGDGVSTLLGVPNPDPTNFTNPDSASTVSVGVMGQLTFGDGSRTQILPDTNGEQAIGFNQFHPSVVLLSGRNITFGRDSTLYAPGASVALDAQRGPPVHDWVRDPATGALVETSDDSRIYLSQGASIDVSGLRNVPVAMERNTIAAQLRANELRDNPIMRDSFLRGQTVYFDARKNITIADASGYYSLIPRDVAELMTEGGSIQLKAPQVITRPGSLIDLSGGSVQYSSGYVKSTRLIDPSGRPVWIEDADPTVQYLGFFGRTTVDHARWGVLQSYASPLFREDQGHYEAGYLEGRSAGVLTVGQTGEVDHSSAAYGYRVFEGDIKADIVVGPNQRGAPSGATAKDVTLIWRERPQGATLNFGFAGLPVGGGFEGGPPPFGGNITIGQGPLLPDDFAFNSRIDPSMEYNHVLPAKYFDGQTFSVLNLYSGKVGTGAGGPGGKLTVSQGTTVDLGDYGKFNFTGTNADIEGTIKAPGGAVNILAPWVAPNPDDPSTPIWSNVDPALRPQITLGPTGVIDVAGRWVNALLNPADRTQLDIRGGSVSLVTSYGLTLAPGSLIDVSGGGRLSSDGKKVTPGAAGSILLFNAHSIRGASVTAPELQSLSLGGTLRGYGLQNGGTLTLGTRGSVVIADQPTRFGPTSFVLSPDFFHQGGFSNFIVSGANGVTVAENTVIAPSTQNFYLADSGRSLSTGATLFGAADLIVQPVDLAQPMSLTLSGPLVDANGSLAKIGPADAPWIPKASDNPGAVTVATGAQIQMLPKSTVRLVSGTNIFVDGTLSAPGGLIHLRGGVDSVSGTGVARAVRLGEHARLLAPGYVQSTPDADQLFTRHTVQDGGSVRIDWFTYPALAVDPNAVGYVMTDAGSLIDVSGIQAMGSLLQTGPPMQPLTNRYVEQLVDGSAGTISIGTGVVSGLGGVLAGRLLLAPGGPSGRGGTLDLSGHQLEITQHVPAGLPHVTATSPINRNKLTLTAFADLINASGADDLLLRPTSINTENGRTRALVFSGDVSLSTRHSIQLGGPTIAVKPDSPGTVTITSEYVSFNPRNSPSEDAIPSSPFPHNLAGRLLVQADLIDIGYAVDFGCGSPQCIAAGNTGFSLDTGFADVHLVSSGDIRLNTQGLSAAPANPRLSAGGTLTLEGAQVYVTSSKASRSSPSDLGFLVTARQSVTINGNGAPAPVPYAYGERLTIRSPDITQAGVLRAPLGEIRLEGLDGNPAHSITLAPGSLTSTSLEGQEEISGYLKVTPDNPFPNLARNGGLDTLPSKAVRISAANATVSEGATIDVSGGGDISSWQFTAGTGGSRNILQDTGTFAIVPSYGGPVPAGWQTTDNEAFYTSVPLRVGDQIYLQGVPGLAPGRYTLLPASFAQQNGGLLLRTVGRSYAQVPGTTMRPDGSQLVGGYRLVDGTPVHDAGYSRFLVMPASVFGKYTTWINYSFNDYVASTAAFNGVAVRSALDAGSVVLGATGSLILNGTGRFNGAGSGLAGNLDISSQRIAVVGGGASAPEGYLSLDASAVSRFGAGSVFIGGTRSLGTGGTNVTVNATNVIVDNNANSALTGSEILIGAQDMLTIRPGSVIEARGPVIADANPLLITGNGALLRVSTGARVDVNRSNASGTGGFLNIGAGVTLRSSGALTLDASNSVQLDPTASFDAERLGLSSLMVSMGDVPVGVPGTVLTDATLARLSTAKDLLIRGRQSIDLYGSFALGGSDSAGGFTLGSLTLDAPELNGHSVGTASISAGSLTLRNSGMARSDSFAPAGSLALHANTLTLGPGTIGIAGLESINATTDTVTAQGAGTLHFGGSMSVATNLVTASAGSDYAVSIDGNLSVVGAGGTARAADDFGGRLSLSGANVTLDTTVDMPAGVFEAHATAGNLTLGNSANLKAQGRAVDFRDVFKVTAGGTLRLTASNDINAASGSRLDVSGDARGGEAGSIEVSAGNMASLQGQIKGSASADYWGGRFSLSAGSLADFAHLNSALELGGMNRSRAIHVLSGDLTLQADQSLTAKQVLLQSDQGAIFVAGTINAAGNGASPSGGSIRLLGGNGVSLASTARLDAHAIAPRPGAFAADSGSVETAATGGQVDVAPGARVDVSGGKQGGGLVMVRASRAGNDIAVNRLNGQFIGARELDLVGMRSYQMDGTVDPGLLTELTDASDWMTHSSEILNRLGTPSFQVQPGILLRSSGDIAVDSDINLFSARYGGAPGYLEFDAAQDIKIFGTSSPRISITDGFDGAGALGAGSSWSYVFQAGRDIVLGDGQGHSGVVRTGTGNIRVQAARDFILKDNSSVLYTAGSRTPTPGFDPIAGTGDFPTQGGNISLTAGRDITAPVANESTSGWLYRYGDTNWTGDPQRSTVARQISWSIVFPNFSQGIGALGGGNVEVAAGGDINQLPVSLPTTGYVTTPVGSVAQAGDVHIRGGGDLTLRAGHDVRGGVFMLGQGAADISAGGRLTYDPTLMVSQRTQVNRNESGSQTYMPRTLAPLFGLADATLKVNARAGAEIEAAFDPMLQGQICLNSGCDGQGVINGSAFYGMTERTSMSVTAVSGNIQYNNNPWASVDVTHLSAREAFMFRNPGSSEPQQRSTDAFARAPGTVQFAALHGDVVLPTKVIGSGGLTLAPTDNGTLELLAQNGINSGTSASWSARMLDIGSSYRRGAADPFAVVQDTKMILRIDQPTAATNYDRGLTPTHANDADPARVYSMTQSLAASGTGANIVVTVPKALSVYTGKDLVLGIFQSQNNRPGDVSSFVAERSVLNPQIRVNGVGDLVVEAGRDIDQKFGDATPRGIVSGGNEIDHTQSLNGANIPNVALSSNQGANIYLFGGSAKDTDYSGFIAAYLDPSNTSHRVRTYLSELSSYLQRLGYNGLSQSEQLALFQSLPLQSRKAFAQQILFTELKETGLDVTDPSSPRYQNYNRGYEAIRLLFPKDPSQLTRDQRSNILLNNQRVETQAGGDITMMSPYGRVDIGGPAITGGAETGGVVTRLGGSVRILADQSIELFASRVFTLAGGDIAMWSSNGDIAAGVGAKTSVFRPPLSYVVDNDGRVSLNVFGLQTGAGIGVLDSGVNGGRRPRSRLDLIAPRGEVNAGDAGIRVVGDINIAALRVVGLENIQVSGRSTGVPKATAPDIALLTETDKVLAAATEKLGPAAQAKAKPEELPSILTVEVIGYETPKGAQESEPEKKQPEEPRRRRR